MRKTIYIVLLLSILVIWLYFPIFKNFFQQDEWSAFANIYLVGYGQYILDALIPDPGHYVPLARILFAAHFKIFLFDYWKWALVSVTWHIANSYLVYLLAKKTFKNDWQAIIGGILFAVFAAGQQATSWVVANSATQGATTLVLLSLIYFFESKIFLCILMLVLSMLFKEISIGMFIFFPIVIMFQNYIAKKKIFDKKMLYFVAVALFYIVFRYLTYLGIFSDVKAPVITETQSKKEILFNIGTFPVKGISQTIIPPYVFLQGSKLIADKLPDGIAGQPGTTFFDEFYLKYVFGILGPSVFVITVVVLAITFKFKKEKLNAIAFLGLLFVGINSAIYALSPGRSGFVPIIDSRNLYMPSIGIVFFIVSVASMLKSRKWSIIILSFFTILNTFITRVEIGDISKIGKNRQIILNQIYKDNLKLRDKQIFYIESDTSYYGLPDEVKILPFQSGFGQTLLVWYQKDESFPVSFFENKFLWPIDSQGYKEIDNRGFGYFRDLGLLKLTLKEYNLSIDSVTAYSWKGKEEKLTNITEEIRLKLKSGKK